MSSIPKRIQLRLKEREDEYIIHEQFHVLVGTFNVNNRSSPPNILLEEWFDQANQGNEQITPDIIAVGFQEVDTSGGAYIYDDKRKEDEWEQVVRKTIEVCFELNKKENIRFELLNRVRLMGILLFVYVRSTHLTNCTSISRSTVPTGFMGIAGNKGGVGIRFRFYETDVCFVNSHFASGDNQTQRRNEDYQTIESRMEFTDTPVYSLKDYFWYTPTTSHSSAPNSSTPSTATQWWKINDHDIIFWFGDMNYRIAHANEQVRKAVEEMSIIPLQEKDQLLCAMKLEHVFSKYEEASIDFRPTYKFDLFTDTYDTSDKARTPSWTDRILYRAKKKEFVQNDETKSKTIQTLRYSSADKIRFSDHRPVSGLYRVAMKYKCDTERSNRIREELLREFDRMANEAIPTIEVTPRPPEIVFHRLRYLDRPNYPLLIKNIGECECVCRIVPASKSDSFQAIDFTPSQPYKIPVKEEQRINVSFKTEKWREPISDILILHVEMGADTFITLDVTFDQGPFGLELDKLPVSRFDRSKNEYIYSIDDKTVSENIVEMKNDPPVLYIALMDTVRERQDLDLFTIFNNETQDGLDLIPLRDQIYENNYKFENYSTPALFMILLHLLQALPNPLISFEIQDDVFKNGQENIGQVVPILIEKLQGKERNLFFHFLILLQKCWPKLQEKQTSDDDDTNDIFNVCLDLLALGMLHDHLDRNQRRIFLLTCLNEDKKN